MPLPNFPNKHRGTVLLTAEDVIAHQRKYGHLKEPPEIDAGIICLKAGLPERMKRKFPIRRAGHYLGDLYLLKGRITKIAVLANFGFGAPVVASLAEELIALGAKQIVSISHAGSLQQGLKSGNLIVCDEAIRDEGTSHHYLPPDKSVKNDSMLSRQVLERLGKAATKGPVWSTDAPFRETREEVAQYQKEGVLAVDMEAAALMAVGQVRGVATAIILVVGDDLSQFEWKPPTDMEAIEEAFEIAYSASVSVLDQPTT